MAKLSKEEIEYFEKAVERQERVEAKLQEEGKLVGRLEPVKGGKGNYVLTEDENGDTRWELTPGSGYDVSLNDRIDNILDMIREVNLENGEELDRVDEWNISTALWATHPEICTALATDEDGKEIFNENVSKLSQLMKNKDAGAYKQLEDTFRGLRNYHNKRPKRLLISNSAVSNSLRSSWDFSEEPRIYAGKDAAGNPVYVEASFSDETFSKRLESVLDLDLMDGIGTLIVEAAEKKGLDKFQLLLSTGFVGSLRFTYPQIYESYTKRRPKNDATIEDLKKRMLRISNVWGHINANAQVKLMRMTEVQGFDQKEQLLMFSETTGRSGGKSVPMVKFEVIPLLFRYAYTFNHVVTIPEEALKVPFERINDARTIITNYLARRVALMKKRNNKIVSDRILLESVWELPGLSKDPRQRRRYLEDIKTILTYWVDISFIENGKIEREEAKNKGAKLTPWRHISIDLKPDIPFTPVKE